MNSCTIFALLLFSIGSTLAQNYGDLRLLQGETADPSFTAGRLEIFINSTWGSICADNFALSEANVACRQLGFQGALSTETSFHTPYGRGTVGPIWLDEVGCENDSIQHLLSCANIGYGEHDCDHFSDVAVECIDQPRVTDPQPMAVRLTGGGFASEGRAEVYCNGSWSAVCDNQMQFGPGEADAVCRQLGYTEAAGFEVGAAVSVEDLDLPAWTGRLKCPMNSTNTSCGECDIDDTDDISECNTVTIRCAHTVPYGSIRLVQGSDPVPTPTVSEGRLEIFRNGIWGTVCSSTFDQIAANISCGELGFLRTLGFDNSTSAGFGKGSGPIHLRAFRCSEEDQALNACPETASSSSSLQNCTHELDVAVICTDDPIFVPPTATVEPEPKGPKISRSTLIGIIVGCSLVVLLFCICCAVCSLHFYLVPYDTKKERHTLYFIEREGSVAGSVLEEEETNLDEKLAALEDRDPFEEMEGGGRGSKFVPRSRPNRYVSLDTAATTQPGEADVPHQQNPPFSSSSVPQPTASREEGSGSSSRPPESPTSLRRVSVHSLHTIGSPLMSQKSPASFWHHRTPSRDSLSSQQSYGAAGGSSSAFVFSSTPTSQRKGSLGSPAPSGIPIPRPLRERNTPSLSSISHIPTSPPNATTMAGTNADSTHFSGSNPALASGNEKSKQARSRHESPQVLSGVRRDSAPSGTPLGTPTKSIIKSSSKDQGTPQPEEVRGGGGEANTAGAGETGGSQEERNGHHHVSFRLD